MFELILVLIGLFVLIIGSLTDIHRREIPDWISFGLLFFGITVNIVRSIIYSDILFIIFSIAGIALAYIIGALLYYTGQWGGGDAKVLMGFGALFGPFTYTNIEVGFINISQISQIIATYNLHFLLIFMLNILIFGAAYSLIWTLARIARRPKVFMHAYTQKRKEMKYANYIQILAVIGTTLGIFLITRDIFVIGFAIAILSITVFLLLFAKLFSHAAEQTFIKDFPIPELTEGEWVVEDIWTPKSKPVSFTEYNTHVHDEYAQMQIEQNIGNAVLRFFSNTQFGHRMLESRMKKQQLNIQELAQTQLTKVKTELEKILAQNGIRNTKSITEILQTKTQDELERVIAKLKPEDTEKVMQDILKYFLTHLYTYDKVYVCGTKDLGVTQKQIDVLKHTHAKSVKVKVGIPFLPSFLIAYIFTIWWGNALAYVFLLVL